MFRFAKYCRLLNGHDLEQEEAERYQARAQRWLAAAGTLLGTAVLSIIVIITRLMLSVVWTELLI